MGTAMSVIVAFLHLGVKKIVTFLPPGRYSLGKGRFCFWFEGEKVAFPSNSRLEALLEAYQDGSLKAFDEFFLKTKDPFFLYIRRRVGNSEVAQDVTQDVYFRLHRYISSFKKGEGKALYWVLSIIQNCIFDHWAKLEEAAPSKS